MILDNTQKKFLLENIHHISSLNNRMAFRLEEKLIVNFLKYGPPHNSRNHTCTPDGSLIIIMRDGQVTGGYPRIFQLNKRSINLYLKKLHGLRLDLNSYRKYNLKIVLFLL